MYIPKSLVSLTLTMFFMGCFSQQASAQRTAHKSVHFGFSQKVSCYALPSGGIELSAGQYQLNSYWTVGVSATDWNQKIRSGESTDYFDHILWNANAGWMYRLFGTYSRWFNFYAGGKVFLGCNQYEAFKPMPQEWEYDYPSAEFIYGLEPCIDMEFFLSKHFALCLGVQAPLTFGSSLPTDIFHLTASLGVRINL